MLSHTLPHPASHRRPSSGTQMGAHGCDCGSEDAKRRQAFSPPAAQSRARLCPTQGILLVQFNSSALLGIRRLLAAAGGGHVGGWRRPGTPPAVALLAARREEPSQEWPPYWQSESNLRLLAAKGLEWRVDSRAPARRSRCARALSASLTAATARGATFASTASAATVRRGRASFCSIRSSRAHCSLNVVCQLFPAPQLWSQVADSTTLAGGSRWSRVILNSTCWSPLQLSRRGEKMHFRPTSFRGSPPHQALPYCFQVPPLPPAIGPQTVVQSLSLIRLFATPWTAAGQTSLSITISPSLLLFMSIESVMPSNHHVLCPPLLLLPSVFPESGSFPMSRPCASGGQNIGASTSASVLPIEHLGLISFMLDLLAVQETLKSLLLHHSSKASILPRL
ncbi:probable N-acetyltransferase 16 [Moschus berezovskii]|uniref:probable N-acetyltransferase 16 n=1 Tax=Moschus berezovskii TaxID=68408 RepID=UPI002443FF0F|nr:probable N-acetyltransferase 16 [Moschus berezovskii]